MLVSVGSIVKSIKGRDENNFYVVVKIDGNNCLIANGKDKPFEKPKKKNLKHLKFINENFINFKNFKNNSAINNHIIQLLNMHK